MEEKKRLRIAGWVRIIALIVLIAGMAGLFYGEFKGLINMTLYRVLIGLLLFLFWAAVDILIPFLTHSLEGLPEKQVKAYRIYALLDMVAYGGLAWFGMSIEGNTALYGAAVFAVATMYKRKYYNKYKGIEDDEDDDEDAGEEAVQEDAGTAGEEPSVPEPSDPDSAVSELPEAESSAAEPAAPDSDESVLSE